MHRYLFIILLLVYLSENRPQYDYWGTQPWNVHHVHHTPIRSHQKYTDELLNRDQSQYDYGSTGYHRPARTGRDLMLGDQNPDFVFPGEQSVLTKTTPKFVNIARRSGGFLPDVSKLSAECRNTGLCNEAIDYPIDHIRSLGNRIDRNLLEQDILPDTNVTISTRIDASTDGVPLCKSKESLIPPFTGQNTKGVWKFIINGEENPQAIRVEICPEVSAPCSLSENFPLTYVTECKQKYIYRKLLAVDEDGDAVSDQFRIPACCVCFYHKVDSRRAINFTPKTRK